MRGLIIGIVIFFVGLMLTVWLLSEQANPQFIQTDPTGEKTSTPQNKPQTK